MDKLIIEVMSGGWKTCEAGTKMIWMGKPEMGGQGGAFEMLIQDLSPEGGKGARHVQNQR